MKIKRFIAAVPIVLTLLTGKPESVNAHCRAYHPHHCSLQMPTADDLIPQELKDSLSQVQEDWANLVNSVCAVPFIVYTNGVYASTVGSPSYTNYRVKSFLVEKGFFNSSDFNNVTILFSSSLAGQAEGMVPAPNTILIDSACRNSSLSKLIPLIAHEMVHVLQIRRMGYERFACTYSENITRLGDAAFYERNPIEREAYELQRSVDQVIQGQNFNPRYALDANGGRGGPYFNVPNGGHNHNLHWRLEPYEDYFILIPRVRQSVGLDANGGRGGPYFNQLNGGHNHNLHWRLEPYGHYYILIPRVRQSVGLDVNGGVSSLYFNGLHGGHNQNLHWRLEPYEDYYILLPRVGGV